MSCIDTKKFSEHQDVSVEYLESQGMATEKAEAVAYDDWKQFVIENSTEREAQIFTQIMNGDGTIDVRFNGSIKPVRMKLIGIHDDGKYFEVALHNPSSKTNTSYRFLHGQSRSVDVKKKEGAKPQYVVISNMGNVFGSSDDVNIDPALYDKQELDLINNIENSNAMLDKLVDIDGQDTSESHKERLKSVLGMFVDSYKNFIPKMNVYLNEQAEKAGGVLRVDDGIYINVSPNGKTTANSASNSEVYVEEITHAATVFAIATGNESAKSAVTRIQQLRDQVRSSLREEFEGEGWKAFMPETSVDKVYEEVEAKKMWDYIFNNEATGLQEFIAKGLTWEVFANKLDKILVQKPVKNEPATILEALMRLVKKIFKLVERSYRKEGFETTATDILVRMSAQLAQANNTAMKQSSDKNYLNDVLSKIDNLDRKMADWAQKQVAKGKALENLPKAPGAGSSNFAYMKYIGRLMPYLLGNKEGTIALKELMYALGFKYGDDVQTFFAQLTDPDNMARAVEYLGLMNENVDRARETRAKVTALQVTEGFKSFSKAEKEALTIAGLDVDIETIYEDYDAAEMLSDDKKLQAEIAKLRSELMRVSDKETGNYYVNQAAGLGFYVATHQSRKPDQLMNATLIGRGHNRIDNRKTPEVDAETIKKIDQLATLEGIKYTPTEAKEVLAELIRREPKGMDYVVKLSRGIKAEARLKVFDDELGMMKGYSKEIFDEDVSILIRPLKDERQLAKDGFKKVVDLEKAAGDTTTLKMAMYVNNWHAQENLKKGALRYTDLHTRGTTLYDLHAMENEVFASARTEINIKNIENEVIKHTRASELGQVVFEDLPTKSLVPVYGRDGRVVNYRYMMSKRAKREFLKQDISAPAVLGRTTASTQDKINTEDHNNKVFDIITDDMKNYNEKTGRSTQLNERHRYFKLEANSHDPMIAEVWKLLPSQMKQRMRDNGMEYMAVRADLFKAYFGMREQGIFDMIGRIPLVGDAIVQLTPKQVKYAIKIAEHIWSNIVNLAKVNIIIKIPRVLLGNIISNIMISVMRGHNPIKVIKLQMRGVTGLFDYLAKVKEFNELENAKLAGNPNGLDIDKIASLKEDLKKHQVADLIDSGMFQAIVEEMAKDEFKSSNKVARFFDDQLDKAPGFIKDGAHLLFLTEKTKYFKFMTTATQFSDFASRYALFELEKEKQLKVLESKFDRKAMIKVSEIPYFIEDDKKSEWVGKQKAKEMLIGRIRNTALDSHVNYSKLDGPILDWLNKVGLAMFTKYAFRIQRPNVKAALEHPLYYFASIFAQKALVNVDDISDSFGNQFSKFGNMNAFFGLIDDLPVYQVLKDVTH